MKEDIKKIVELACRAPSGDNRQPWKLIVHDNRVELFNDITRDTSIYNFRQIASYLANGALIENIIIVASSFGYKVNLKLFPEIYLVNENLIAHIELEKANIEKDLLFDSIRKRTNNRKAYKRENLGQENIDRLLKAGNFLPEVEFKLVDEPYLINSIAEAGSKNEKIVLENKKLHNFLFENVVWTKKKAEKKGEGIYVKTLEMPPSAQLIFKACSNWHVMKNLSKIGMSSAIAKQNQQIYMKAGAYGAIVIKNDSPLDIVQSGRSMERVWLEATSLGLSFNAMAGIVLLNYRTEHVEEDLFSEKQLMLIRDSYEEIRKAFNVEDGFIPFVFRLGKAKLASAESYRLPVDKVLTFK